jgi:hypothetical protein
MAPDDSLQRITVARDLHVEARKASVGFEVSPPGSRAIGALVTVDD